MSIATAAVFAFHGMATRDFELPRRRLVELGWTVLTIGLSVGPVNGFDPLSHSSVEHAFGDVERPSLVVIPGGFDWRSLAQHEDLRAWLADAHRSGSFAVGISTGALVVAAAGLVDQRPATGHWLALDELRTLGAQVDPTALVRADRVFTAAGASGGVLAIDAIDRELRWGPGPAVSAT